MKHLYNFESFIVNETLGDLLTLPVDPIPGSLEVFKDIVREIQDLSIEDITNKIYELGFKASHYIIDFIKRIYNKILDLKERNPKLFKAIVICILIILFVLICTSSTYAQKTGGNPPISLINSAIGLLESIQKEGQHDPKTVQKAMAYLIELKRGNTIRVDNDTMDMIKTSVTYVKEMMEETNKSNPDYSLLQKMSQYAEKGSEYISAQIISSESPFGYEEKIRLVRNK